MIRIEHTEVYGWEAAIRGMRNPMNSWDKSDSYYGCNGESCTQSCADWWECFGLRGRYVVEDNDLKLMKSLAKGGAVHAKYRRMINVTCDITAPLYWFKEFDTAKVGTVANSCSTMHKIHAKEFTFDDFSHEHLLDAFKADLKKTIQSLNAARQMFLRTKDKDFWWAMIQLLPSSYNQKRTVQLNYEVLTMMYRDRKNHKLDEWREFCKWIEMLPYSEIITGEVRDGQEA